MSVRTTLMGLAVWTALIATATWFVQESRYSTKLLKLESEKLALDITATALANEAAERYEDFKVVIQREEVIVNKVLKTIVERPVYRNICIDEDGLAALNKLILP